MPLCILVMQFGVLYELAFEFCSSKIRVFKEVWPGESSKLSFSIQKIMYAFLVWRVICVKTMFSSIICILPNKVICFKGYHLQSIAIAKHLRA